MLSFVKQFKAREWVLLAISVIAVVASVYMELSIPDYMRTITTLLTGQQATENLTMDVLKNGGIMIGFAIGGFVATTASSLISSYISSYAAYGIRESLFNHVTDLDSANVKAFSTASLLTRTTNDVTQVQNLIAFGMTQLIKAPILAVWAVIKIVGSSWQLSVLTAVVIVILVTVLVTLMACLLPRFKRVQRLLDSINRVARENLTGMKVVRAFNAEDHEASKFAKVSEELVGVQLINRNALSIISPTMIIVMSGLNMAIYWLGAWLINQAGGFAEQASTYADVVVFGSYAMYVIQGFMMLSMIFMMWPQTKVSANRINEVLKTPVKIRSGTVTETSVKGKIEFRDVSFHYEGDKDVLKHISFTAEPGEMVAFIGATGCGKSTLVGLAARLYDPTEGTILFDDIDIREFDLDGLYEKIGYVPQKAVLFKDSVEDNVTFGDEDDSISQEDVKEALRIAQAEDFVASLPEGVQFQVAQGGGNLSGGQKQRLSIARAVAKKPEILIFDDSFSALDFATDKALREELARSLRGTTTLVVGQRIATIKDADKIVVLEKGEIVGIGRHEELLETCPVYREIALSQLSEDEISMKGGKR